MPREAPPVTYAWAAVAVGRHRLTLGHLAVALGVGRHRARRVLLASPAVHAAHLVRRRWQAPDGRVLTRAAWSIPPKAIAFLLMAREQPKIVRLAKRLRIESRLPASWAVERARFLRVTEKAASRRLQRGAAGPHTPVRQSDAPRVVRRTPGGHR